MYRALTTPPPRPVGSTAVEHPWVGLLEIDGLTVRGLDVLKKA